MVSIGGPIEPGEGEQTTVPSLYFRA